MIAFSDRTTEEIIAAWWRAEKQLATGLGTRAEREHLRVVADRLCVAMARTLVEHERCEKGGGS